MYPECLRRLCLTHSRAHSHVRSTPGLAVVWTPWTENAKKMADFGDDEVCSHAQTPPKQRKSDACRNLFYLCLFVPRPFLA